jgi:replication factor A1
MDKTADELEELKENSTEYDACFQQPLCKAFIFRCRAKQDTYQDQTRVRYQVLNAAQINYAAEATKLAEQIKLYSL